MEFLLRQHDFLYAFLLTFPLSGYLEYSGFRRERLKIRVLQFIEAV